MGKLKNEIRDLIERSYSRGLDGVKIAQRLVEAAADMTCEAHGYGSLDAVVRANEGHFDFNGHFNENGLAELHFGHSPRQIEDAATIRSMSALLTEAAETFKEYGHNHGAKSPPQVEKALRNYEMAQKCYNQLGVAFDIPEFGEISPVQSDSEPEVPSLAPEALRVLLSLVFKAEEPVHGFDIYREGGDAYNQALELGYLTVDDVSDVIVITSAGRDYLGIELPGAIDIPVTVESITGDRRETELISEYIASKVKGLDRLMLLDAPRYSEMVEWREAYMTFGKMLTEIAYEVKKGMHLPTIHLEGRVLPYNTDNSTGIHHATALKTFFDDVHARNVKAGWWTNIETGEPLKRNVGEMFVLMVTELAEAYEGWLNGDMDDKLPEHPAIGVELGDLIIRVADFCGALSAGRVLNPEPRVHNPGDDMFREIVAIANRYESIRKTPHAKGDPEIAEFIPDPMDVSVMIDQKLEYNATRSDHQIANRLKPDGKRT